MVAVAVAVAVTVVEAEAGAEAEAEAVCVRPKHERKVALKTLCSSNCCFSLLLFECHSNASASSSRRGGDRVKMLFEDNTGV